MKNIKSIVKIIFTTIVASLTLATGALAWGPEERPTFTMESPATYPVFNSITNNPEIGDERDFVRVGEINAEVTDLKNEIEVIPGKQYLVYVYIHNNASATYNDSAHHNSGVAVRTRISTFFPTVLTPSEKGKISATITADNSNPLSVWDEAYFTTKTSKVLLSYVEDSAKIYNRKDYATNGSGMPSSLFTETGALVGLNALNGVMPGCEQFHSVVTYVVEAKELSGSITKTASKSAIAVDEEVEFKLEIKNTGDIALTNATVKDSLPEGLTLVPGSVYLSANDSTTKDQLSDNLISTGYNLGRIGTGNVVYITYQAKAGTDFDCNGSKLNNIATLVYDSEESSGDTNTASASIIVRKVEDCEQVPTEPEIPAEPEKPTEPEKPAPEEERPKEIVNTGPLEITLAVIIVLAILGAGIYYWRTHHTLKKVENKVSGKTPKEQNETPKNLDQASEKHETPNNREVKNLDQKPDEHSKDSTSSQKS